MPSPFPGMDPYLESQRNWSGFHHGLADEISAQLNRSVRPKYYARSVTYATYDVIEVAESVSRTIYPDVSVWQRPGNVPPLSGVAVIDPPQTQSIVKVETPLRLANVEVRMAGNDRLITAIEILSPINKRSGTERDKYLRKRRELLQSEVHVLEIDLLRGGQRSPLETTVPTAPYYVTLSRENRRPYVDVWSIQLNQRLPVVAVPLARTDNDIALDLGAVIREVYERGGFDVSIDYRQPVPPPTLSEQEAAWVEELLAHYRKTENLN